jgi:hypothetical protein
VTKLELIQIGESVGVRDGGHFASPCHFRKTWPVLMKLMLEIAS